MNVDEARRAVNTTMEEAGTANASKEAGRLALIIGVEMRLGTESTGRGGVASFLTMAKL